MDAFIEKIGSGRKEPFKLLGRTILNKGPDMLYIGKYYHLTKKQGRMISGLFLFAIILSILTSVQVLISFIAGFYLFKAFTYRDVGTYQIYPPHRFREGMDVSVVLDEKGNIRVVTPKCQ